MNDKPFRASRTVKNVPAYDATWHRNETWRPPEPQPFVVGRDPYASTRRTPDGDKKR